MKLRLKLSLAERMSKESGIEMKDQIQEILRDIQSMRKHLRWLVVSLVFIMLIGIAFIVGLIELTN